MENDHVEFPKDQYLAPPFSVKHKLYNSLQGRLGPILGKQKKTFPTSTTKFQIQKYLCIGNPLQSTNALLATNYKFILGI